jgi:hypothetical protein
MVDSKVTKHSSHHRRMDRRAQRYYCEFWHSSPESYKSYDVTNFKTDRRVWSNNVAKGKIIKGKYVDYI